MLRLVAALIGGSIVAVVLCLSTPVSADDKSMSIEDIMKKLHGKTGSHKQINKALDGTPDWDTITKHAKIYADLAGMLPKAKPEKGDDKSWKMLSEAYAKEAKALNEAAAKKDADTVKTVFGRLKESCDGCHENHR
ncbi:MAG TPA: cytochrome c [Gemmataceae bacterium]|jgi:cytochrome c556|nr:cytochrome c [Gemmataceae bacterium]